MSMSSMLPMKAPVSFSSMEKRAAFSASFFWTQRHSFSSEIGSRRLPMSFPTRSQSLTMAR